MDVGRGWSQAGAGGVTISPGGHLALLTQGGGTPRLLVTVQGSAATEDPVDVLNITKCNII